MLKDNALKEVFLGTDVLPLSQVCDICYLPLLCENYLWSVIPKQYFLVDDFYVSEQL